MANSAERSGIPAIPAQAIRQHVEEVIHSAPFAGSERLRRLLHYLVEQALSGDGIRLKEYTIGLDVFQRGPDYDPQIDSTVRVHAGKLRDKLREYYLTEGRHAEVRIELPKGSYVPLFHGRTSPAIGHTPHPGAEATTLPNTTGNAEAPLVPLPSGGGRSTKTWMALIAVVGVTAIAAAGLHIRNRSTVADRHSASIAVLPFADMSPGRDQEYFCDGITEELINALSRVKGLHVVARTSAFEFKGKSLDIRKIGAQLNVGSVLEGSVRRDGEKLRITAQLNEARDGYHLWSATYDRQATDLFAVQEEIARAVVNALQLELMSPGTALARAYTNNIEVQNLYLLGRYHWNRRPAEKELNLAINYFRRAVEADPRHAPAWVGLADCVFQLAVWDHRPPREAVPEARAYAEKALAIDSELADAHTTRAAIAAAYDYNPALAFTEVDRGLKLNPGFAPAHLLRAVFEEAARRLDTAVSELKVAADLDPLSIGIGSDLGRILIRRGEYDRGMEQLSRMLALDPDSLRVHWYMAEALNQRGRQAEAIALMEKARALAPDYPRVLGSLGYMYAAGGNRPAALNVLEALQNLRKQRYVPSADIAFIYAGLGDTNRTFEWLEKAYDERYPLYLQFTVSRAFDRLQSDPRFPALMKKLGW